MNTLSNFGETVMMAWGAEMKITVGKRNGSCQGPKHIDSFGAHATSTMTQIATRHFSHLRAPVHGTDRSPRSLNSVAPLSPILPPGALVPLPLWLSAPIVLWRSATKAKTLPGARRCNCHGGQQSLSTISSPEHVYAHVLSIQTAHSKKPVESVEPIMIPSPRIRP